MPTFRLEGEDGTWLTDMRLNGFDWRPGDRIPRGPELGSLEVVALRDDAESEKPVLVVRGSKGQ